MSAPVGLILAGGRARRLGGGDKPLRDVGGEPILSRIVARLRPQCEGLLVSANDPAPYASHGLEVVADEPGLAEGPLAGVLAGLDHLARRGSTALMLSVSGDAPFLPPDLSARLGAARDAHGTMLACARSEGRDHPTIALWPTEARGPLRAALEAGRFKVGALVAELGVVAVDWACLPVDPFFNVNTPEDLERARALVLTLDRAPPCEGRA